MSKSTSFPFHLVFTDTQGREHGYGQYRSLEAAVAVLEHKITPPFGGKPASYYLNIAAGYASATVKGIGMWEIR